MQYKKQHYQKCPRCNKEGWKNDYICHKHKPATKDSVKKREGEIIETTYQ